MGDAKDPRAGLADLDGSAVCRVAGDDNRVRDHETVFGIGSVRGIDYHVLRAARDGRIRLLDRVGDGGEGMLRRAVVVVTTGRRHAEAHAEVRRHLERRSRREGGGRRGVGDARRQRSSPIDERLAGIRRRRHGDRRVGGVPGGAGRRNRAVSAGDDIPLHRRRLPHPLEPAKRRWRRMGIDERQGVAAVDDAVVRVVEPPARAGIFDGLRGVRPGNRAAAGDDEVGAGGKAGEVAVGGTRPAGALRRAGDHEARIVDGLREALLVNRLVGEDFRVRQLAVVEANRVDGARE